MRVCTLVCVSAESSRAPSHEAGLRQGEIWDEGLSACQGGRRCSGAERPRRGPAQAKDALRCSVSPLASQVPDVMKTLWKAMYTVQQSTLRDLLFKAACLLAGFHLQPVVDSLLQTELLSERYVRSPLAPLWPNSNPKLACSREIQGSSRSHSSPRSLSSARSCARASGEAGIVCPAAGEESVWPLGRAPGVPEDGAHG